MKKASTLAILALGLAGITQDAAATKLFVVTGSDSWQNHNDGIAQFTAEDPSDYTMVYDDINACTEQGWPDWYLRKTSLFYYAGHNKIMGYYPKRVSQDEFSYYFERISWATYEYDGTTFSQSSLVRESIPAGPGTNEFAFPNMITYNPVSGKVYGSNIDIDYNTGAYSTVIREIDPATGQRGAEVARLVQKSINSLTTDARGVIYVTQSNGSLGTLNLESGQINVLGNIDIYKNETAWSCFDYSTGKLYLIWNYDIYEIDVNAVSAKKLSSIPVPNNSLIRGVFCFNQTEVGEKAAPSAPTGLAAEFSAPGSLSAELSAVAPEFCFDGSTPLSGKVDVEFFVDGAAEAVATVKGLSPGQTAKAAYTFSDEGSHTVTAAASNEAGESAPATLVVWAGYDVPEAPGTPSLTIGSDGSFEASWTAPAKGAHGGVIDMATLKYKATVNPVGQEFTGIASTTLKGRLESTAFNGYSISVVAIADGKASEPATSSVVRHGQSFEPAWTEDFTNPGTFGQYVTEDANGDGTTWEFKNYFNIPCVQINGYSSKSEMDDWMVTPPVRMRKGAVYTVSHNAFAGIVDTNPGKIEIYAGTSPDTGSMTRISSVSVETYPGKGNQKSTYTATADGDVYFAFRALSPAGSTIGLQYISVEATPVEGAPAAPSAIEVIPGEKGKLTATVNFTAPTADNLGNPLSGIHEARLLIDGNPKAAARMADVAPGEKKSFTVDVASIGNHNFSVVCYNDKGIGEAAETPLWIGEDIAAKVNNFAIEETETCYMVTWDAPTESIHGMYIDYPNLTYEVMLWLTGMDEPMTYATGLKETSCEVHYEDILRRVPVFNGQINVEIYVFPLSAAGYGQATGATMVYGESYKLPFAESFANGGLSTSPWTTIEVGDNYMGAWAGFRDDSSKNPNLEITSADDDCGMAAFYQTKMSEYTERLISPRLNKEAGKMYMLSFYTYHLPDAEDSNILQPEANIGGTEFIDLGEPVAVNKGDGWTKHTVLMDKLPDGDFRLSFKATGTAGTPIYLDNIRIDLAQGIASAEADGISVKALRGAVAITAPEADYTVWNANGAAVASGKVRGTATVALAPGIYVVRAGGKTAKCVVR